MSGRRSHQRFTVLALPEGILRVKGDVVVQSATVDQLVVVSRQPGIPGETVSVQSPDDAKTSMMARVLGSQPIVMDGSVRHQVLLRNIGGEDGGQ